MINCKNLIIANFGLEASIFNRYLDTLAQAFHSLEGHNQHEVEVVAKEQFVPKVLSHPQNSGICIAASGVKECSDLNKQAKIRAALIHTSYLADMCRQHNDSNVIIFGTDCLGEKLCASLLCTYLGSGFDHGEKNKLRIEKMGQLEEKHLLE